MKTIAQQLNIKEFPFEIKDKNGKVIYFENSHGYWVKSEYDSNGNQIYSETSDGNWNRIECDSNGNVIYCESSHGGWSKREYDSNGNQIYYESSDGFIVDNRPKSCEGKVVEIDGKKYKLIEIK
jgi:uncharacterized membrane protein